MRRVTEKTLNPVEALSKAYALSYPILAGDTERSLEVVVESVNEWKVDWLAQKHRTYHKPRPNRTPNKVILSRPALLQYIVCEQTTDYEKAHETAFLKGEGSLTERTLLLRYAKHLLHKSFERSFHVAIANCRILHKYDHATTRSFYAVLDQRDQQLLVEGEADNKTDGEYRRVKMNLVGELEKRFAEFLSVVHGPRNEKRFLSNNQPGKWAAYITECLGLLTPWKSEHVLPQEFTPTIFNITQFQCEGRRDKWDSVEGNRMHTIIDPECFSRLAKGCGAPAPEQQLDIPQFKHVEHEPGGGLGQTSAPPELSVTQITAIMDQLQTRGVRRRVAVSEYLSIEVDRVERGSLDTTSSSGIRLDLSPESRQIQVFTTDAEGKLLLASLWLSFIDITADTGWQSSITLEGGQRLGIDIQPVLNAAGEIESLATQISYKEYNPLRILTHYFQQIGDAVSRHVRLLLQSLYGHRKAFATFVLFVAITLCLLIPSYKSDRPAEVSTHSESARKVVAQQSTPTLENSEGFTPYARVTGRLRPGVPARDRSPVSREQIVQLSQRLDGLDLTSVYSTEPREQALPVSLAERQALQTLDKNRFVIFGSYTGSELPSSVENSAGTLATSDYRPVFFHTTDIEGSKVVAAYRTNLAWAFSPSNIPTEARVTVVDRFHDHFFSTSPFNAMELRLASFSDRDFESDVELRSLNFSSGTLNLESRGPTLVAGLSCAGDDARAFRRNRFQLDLPESGQTAKTEFSWGNSAAYYRATAYYRTLKMERTSPEHTSVRPMQLDFDFFNVFNTARRSPGATTALFKIGDTSRVTNFAAVNCVAPNPTDCENPAPVGNTSSMRIGLKFKF